MSHCSSSTFRARVERVLQAVMAHTATEMVQLFEEACVALRTEALQSQRRRRNLESILCVSAHTAAAETASDRNAMGAEVLPAVEQVLSGEEALSLFGPVEDDDWTVTESPGPSQARDVNLTGPSSHTAVSGRVKMAGPPRTAVRGRVMMTGPSSRDVEHKENMGATSVSEEGSQAFSVTAVKMEKDDMDDDHEGYDDSRSYAQPEYRYNTDEELPEDDDTSYTPKKRKRMRGRKRGTKCRVCKTSYFFGLAEHQKECRGALVCTCNYCGKTFDNRSSLTHHKISHSSKRYSCTFCDKTFVYDKCRVVHERNQHSNTKYWCSDCGKMFQERLERDQHECIVFTGSFAFTCTECNKGFNRQYILKKHQLAEHPEIFSNNQKVQVGEVEVGEVHVKIEEDYEQDMDPTNYGYEQDMDLNSYFSYEQDMDLKNQDYEQDMGLEIQDYGQDVGLNNQDYEHCIGLNNHVKEQDIDLNDQVKEQDIDLNNQVKEQDMDLKNDVCKQDMGLKNDGYEQDMGLKNEGYDQDMGLKNQDYGQDIGLNNQDYEHDIGLNNQMHEQDMGLINQVYEQDMGHEGYEQYMGFMNLPEKGHFNLE